MEMVKYYSIVIFLVLITIKEISHNRTFNFQISWSIKVENSSKKMLLQKKVICTTKATELQNMKRFYIFYLNIHGQIDTESLPYKTSVDRHICE